MLATMWQITCGFIKSSHRQHRRFRRTDKNGRGRPQTKSRSGAANPSAARPSSDKGLSRPQIPGCLPYPLKVPFLGEEISRPLSVLLKRIVSGLLIELAEAV